LHGYHAKIRIASLEGLEQQQKPPRLLALVKYRGISYISRIDGAIVCEVAGRGDRDMTGDEKASSSGGLRGVRVLAAEDEPMLLMALEDMLGEFGCEVVACATTVTQALEMGSSKEFDVAILDVNLARETVEPAALAIQARGIPIVLVTGHVASDIGARFGAASVVEKPYTPDALQKALTSAMARS